MSLGLHIHAQRRKKKFSKFNFLRRKKSILLIDRWIMVVGILSPLSSLPQIIQILTTKNADGVSTLTWSMCVFLGLFWLIYGIAHKEKVLIVNNILWIILEVVIVALSIIY